MKRIFDRTTGKFDEFLVELNRPIWVSTLREEAREAEQVREEKKS
jgi:hypothetical protein